MHSWEIDRLEKGESQEVIPVRVGEDEFELPLPFLEEGVPQLPDP
jgi:hypothetical protein